VCPSRGVVYRKTMEFTLENGKSIKPQNNLEILASQEVKWVRRIPSKSHSTILSSFDTDR